MSDGFPYLDRLRRGATVTRYHTHRVQRPQSVGEHSHGVALIARHLCRVAGYESAAVVDAALEHDLAEFECGDSPAPAKRRSPAFRAELDKLEHDINTRLGLMRQDLDPTLSAILGVADEVEFLWYSLDERRLGNVDFERTFCLGMLGCEERLYKHELALINETWASLWISEARAILHDLRGTMKSIMGTERFFVVAAAAANERAGQATGA